MKFTWSWLQKHIDVSLSLEELETQLSLIGLEVESIENPAQKYQNIVIAKILESKPHPDSDHLSICQVDAGDEVLQVVCGAPNARKGLVSALAKVGATLPNDQGRIQKVQLRGVESRGMLCSLKELDLGEEHQGIVEFEDQWESGTPLSQALHLDDPIVEVSVTPNRPDWLGVRGIARELQALGLGKLKALVKPEIQTFGPSPIRVQIEDPKSCPVFAGRLIRGVQNKPSPPWLQHWLRSIGLRPISALVDITNFFTFDQCRPLHVFDAQKIQGHLVIRGAQKGETLLALDDRNYELDEGMTVIADDSGVLSLGGVIGGESTGVSLETTDVFLECAHFDPIRTAITGRKLKIQSDARFRFERGVDPESVIPGIEAATAMILELCGGEASDLYIAGQVPQTLRQIEFRPQRVLSLGGVELAPSRMKAILQNLGFQVKEGKIWSITPPSWRADVLGEADIVEEILRIEGYDRIPTQSFVSDKPLPQPATSPRWRATSRVRRTLALQGLFEAVTWSFVDYEWAKYFGNIPKSLKISNPISAHLDTLRPSILPNLLQALKKNHSRGQSNLALFEIGPTYRSDRPEGQHLHATGIRSGLAVEKHWLEQARPVDFYDVKSDVFQALSAWDPLWKNKTWTLERAESPIYHPGRSAVIKGDKTWAIFGELHPGLLKALGIKVKPIVAFELFLDHLPLEKRKEGQARAFVQWSPYQAVYRDFAFTVPQEVDAQMLEDWVRKVDPTLVEEVRIFDVYQGKGVEQGHRSIAFKVKLQPHDHTLRDAEIEAFAQKLIRVLGEQTGARLRS